MKPSLHRPFPASRRSFLKAILAAGSAPLVVPARVLGAAGPAPSGKINLGVIGVGAQGTSDMTGFLAQPDVRVAAICDVNQRSLDNARKLIAAKYGKDEVRQYRDFRELNADPALDAVLLALPFHWHSIPALDAIAHGKHLYHEKPMALSFEEGRRVRAAVRKRGVVFQFGTQQRSENKFRWACELALNGRLGKLREIRVSAPGGITSPLWPEQPVPAHVDWDRWVGPAALTPFHDAKLKRANHENMANFSLGMIACWGIHHLDIAQWGNGADATGPVSVQGEGQFPREGSCDAILGWRVRYEFAQGAPIVFVQDGTEGFDHGIRFIGEAGWAHVRRGDLKASSDGLLADPQNQCGAMPVRLPVSNHHTRNFLDAIKNRTRPICDIETAMRSDTLCQLGHIAVRQARKLQWDPQAERFVNDEAANGMLQPRPFRSEWRLPKVG
jgi:predicted dehydrogenase